MNQWAISWIFNELNSRELRSEKLKYRFLKKEQRLRLLISVFSCNSFPCLLKRISDFLEKSLTFPLVFLEKISTESANDFSSFHRILHFYMLFTFFLAQFKLNSLVRKKNSSSWFFFNLNYFHSTKHVTHFGGKFLGVFFKIRSIFRQMHI